MFSLIITLISIALVAALALATLYYGGPVFNQGAARAHAAKIAAQGQQIQGAAELYKADNGEYPVSLAELVAQNYLKSVPVAAAQEQVLLNNALAAASWVMVAPKTPVFALTGVSEATCKAVNLGSYGVEGILKTARETNRVQCYGTSTGSLMIVQAKSPADLVAASTHPAAVIQVGAVLPAPIPTADSTDTSDAGWLVSPSAGTPVVAPPTPANIIAYSANGSAITQLSLPSASVGASSQITVTLQNSSSQTYDFSGITAPAPFSVKSTTCFEDSFFAGESCIVTLSFSPTAVQTYSGASFALNVTSSGVGALNALPLTGEGTPSQAVASVVARTELNAVPEFILGGTRYHLRLSEVPGTNYFNWTGSWSGGRWENNAAFFYPFWAGLTTDIHSETSLQPALEGGDLFVKSHGAGGYADELGSGFGQPLTFYGMWGQQYPDGNGDSFLAAAQGSPVAQLPAWTTGDAAGPTWCITWSETGGSLPHVISMQGALGPVPELVGTAVSGSCK